MRQQSEPDRWEGKVTYEKYQIAQKVPSEKHPKLNVKTIRLGFSPDITEEEEEREGQEVVGVAEEEDPGKGEHLIFSFDGIEMGGKGEKYINGIF